MLSPEVMDVFCVVFSSKYIVLFCLVLSSEFVDFYCVLFFCEVRDFSCVFFLSFEGSGYRFLLCFCCRVKVQISVFCPVKVRLLLCFCCPVKVQISPVFLLYCEGTDFSCEGTGSSRVFVAL